MKVVVAQVYRVQSEDPPVSALAVSSRYYDVSPSVVVSAARGYCCLHYRRYDCS